MIILIQNLFRNSCNRADMTYVMKLIDQRTQVASIELAGALLRAWLRRDRRAFDAEVDRSSRTSQQHDDAGEAERLQIISVIADRLKSCDDPFSQGDSDLGMDVCARLLSHLASPAITKETNRAGWCEVRSVTRLGRPGSVRSTPVHLGISILH
jgi:hypothetical protein